MARTKKTTPGKPFVARLFEAFKDFFDAIDELLPHWFRHNDTHVPVYLLFILLHTTMMSCTTKENRAPSPSVFVAAHVHASGEDLFIIDGHYLLDSTFHLYDDAYIEAMKKANSSLRGIVYFIHWKEKRLFPNRFTHNSRCTEDHYFSVNVKASDLPRAKSILEQEANKLMTSGYKNACLIVGLSLYDEYDTLMLEAILLERTNLESFAWARNYTPIKKVFDGQK